MTLTANNSVGFEKSYNKALAPANAILFDGATATTYTKGRLVGISNGLLSELSGTSTANASLPIAGVVAETKVTTDSDKKVKVHQGQNEVFTVSFDGHEDATISGSTADNQVKLTSDSTASAIGKLVHIYEGPAQGDAQVISASSTSTGTLTLTVSGEFAQRPTSGKAIVASIQPGTFLKVSTANASKVAAGAGQTAGVGQVIVQSADPGNLKVDVLLAPNKTIFGMGQTAT